MSQRSAPGRLTIRSSLFGAILLLGTGAALSGSVDAQPARVGGPEDRAVALVRPALVYVETFWAGVVSDEDGVAFNDGNPFEFSTSCTGFVVNPVGAIITAGHCVDDSDAFGGIQRDFIEIAAQEAFEEGTYEGAPSVEELSKFGLVNWSVGGPETGTRVEREVFVQRGRAVSGDRSRETLPAEVVDFRSAEAGDVALIEVEALDLPSVMVSGVNELETGTELLSLGYPGLTEGAEDESLEPAHRAGEISAKKAQGNYPVYEVSAAIASGMSGGPAVNLEGEVIGVNSFGIGDSDAFNFIAPASYIREILAKNNTKNRLGRIDTIYREGLAAFYARDYVAATAAFDRVIDLDPRHDQARAYRREAAQERPSPAEVQGGGFPVLPVAVAAVVALGLVGGGMSMRWRRKRAEELLLPAESGAPEDAAR